MNVHVKVERPLLAAPSEDLLLDARNAANIAAVVTEALCQPAQILTTRDADAVMAAVYAAREAVAALEAQVYGGTHGQS